MKTTRFSMLTFPEHLALVVLVVTIPAACKKSEDGAETGTPGTPAAASASASAAPQARKARRELQPGDPTGRWRGRPERLLTAALEQATLTEPQKEKLEALAKRLDGDTRTDQELRDFRVALAESAKNGALDAKKLEQRLKAIEQAAKQKQDENVKLVNELHAALDGAQRKTIVSAVRKELLPLKAPPASEREKVRKEREKSRVERLARDLGLNENQTKQLEQIDARWRESDPNDFQTIREESQKRLSELLTAFEHDPFDASRHKLLPLTTEGAAQRAEHELKRVKALLPMLTPEQRVKLGEQIERTVGGARSAHVQRASVAADSSAR